MFYMLSDLSWGTFALMFGDMEGEGMHCNLLDFIFLLRYWIFGVSASSFACCLRPKSATPYYVSNICLHHNIAIIMPGLFKLTTWDIQGVDML